MVSMEEKLPAGWEPIQAGAPFEAELSREIGTAHLLHGIAARAIARRADQDDVLFALSGSKHRFAVVHLTWKGHAQPDPAWPHTQFYGSIAEATA